MDFDEGSDLDFDLTPLIAHNASFDLTISDPPSPETNSVPELPQIQQRPISKRRGKKRSSRACASCRARKVRCNIVAHGAPCSNCRHDEVDCILPLSRRQRAAKERAEQQQKFQTQTQTQTQAQTIPTTSIYSCESGENCCPHENQDIEPDHCYEDERREQLIPPHGMTISEHPLCEILPAHSASQRGSPVLGPTILPKTQKKGSRAGRIDIQAPLASAPTSTSKLPRIFALFPAHLTPTDIAYLTTRGALTLPSERMQVALLQAYVEFIHPVLPILDIDEFLDSVKYGQGKKISLLLFQAVMLAAVGCVSQKVLRTECEGMGRGEVVRGMIEKVKLLYDFDTTTADRLTIIQSLLLFSYSLSNTPTSPSLAPTYKNAHHYLGLALSLSFSLGLHRNPSPTAPSHSTPPHQDQNTTIAAFHNSALRLKRLERKIWWSLFLQDKLLDMNGKGISRLRRQDFDVTVLSWEDFDLQLDDEGEGIREVMEARAFVERIRLCLWSMRESSFQQQPQQRSLAPQGHSQPQSSPTPLFITSSPSLQQQQEEEKYHITSPSYSTSESEVLTPQEEYSYLLNPLSTEEEACEKEKTGDLDAGPGVDGEYDDYLEFLGV